ncbi:MAG: glutamine synthetase family protein [Chloroflexota bacterium]
MAGNLTFDELKLATNFGSNTTSNMNHNKNIDTVLACIVDMYGRLIGKRFHARYFVDSAHDETHGCDYLLANDIDMEPVPGYAASSWERGYGDFVMKPDLNTLRRIPWLEGTALVLCDVLDHHHHQPLPHSPRAILKRQLARLTDRDLCAFFASELEFYLFDETFRSAYDKGYGRGAENLQTAGYYIEDYHIFQTTKEEPVMRTIRNGLQHAGIPVENSKGEWGPGQEEINVRYASALEMADRHVILKNGIKEMAYQQGKAVTFMAKWDYELAGSSCHIHASLWDSAGETPHFYEPNASLGMSPLMRQFMAGQLKYAKDITYLLAPFINSYKRFQAGTFAPTKIVWSADNRTAGFRLCGENTKAVRVECRIGGADLNPYLAYAGLLAAGLAGIEEQLELDEPFNGDAYQDATLQDIPKTLRESTEALNNSAMLRNALGDDVVDHYVHTARWEQFEYDRRVTDWELQRGFEKA